MEAPAGGKHKVLYRAQDEIAQIRRRQRYRLVQSVQSVHDSSELAARSHRLVVGDLCQSVNGRLCWTLHREEVTPRIDGDKVCAYQTSVYVVA